jgi:hypothetical protein
MLTDLYQRRYISRTIKKTAHTKIINIWGAAIWVKNVCSIVKLFNLTVRKTTAYSKSLFLMGMGINLISWQPYLWKININTRIEYNDRLTHIKFNIMTDISLENKYQYENWIQRQTHAHQKWYHDRHIFGKSISIQELNTTADHAH